MTRQAKKAAPAEPKKTGRVWTLEQKLAEEQALLEEKQRALQELLADKKLMERIQAARAGRHAADDRVEAAEKHRRKREHAAYVAVGLLGPALHRADPDDAAIAVMRDLVAQRAGLKTFHEVQSLGSQWSLAAAEAARDACMSILENDRDYQQAQKELSDAEADVERLHAFWGQVEAPLDRARDEVTEVEGRVRTIRENIERLRLNAKIRAVGIEPEPEVAAVVQAKAARSYLSRLKQGELTFTYDPDLLRAEAKEAYRRWATGQKAYNVRRRTGK